MLSIYHVTVSPLPDPRVRSAADVKGVWNLGMPIMVHFGAGQVSTGEITCDKDDKGIPRQRGDIKITRLQKPLKTDTNESTVPSNLFPIALEHFTG